jgi:hypothetical protein
LNLPILLLLKNRVLWAMILCFASKMIVMKPTQATFEFQRE